jgi:hypothetical protein
MFLGVLASSAHGADPSLPWSFVNGSAKGYSIQLLSASPLPGTRVAAGQTVEFKVTVTYQLSMADKGSIVLVVQDENNKDLLESKLQPSQIVDRGKGRATLTESFTVPTGIYEVRLFLPLVPQGLEHTEGELVLRYPVSNEVKSSSIGYPSVLAALADLRSKPDVQFSEAHGWTIADDRSHFTIWSFAPANDPAYPSAVKRTALQEGSGVSMQMNVLCESTQSACDKLVSDFQAPNDHMRDSFKSKWRGEDAIVGDKKRLVVGLALAKLRMDCDEEE